MEIMDKNNIGISDDSRVETTFNYKITSNNTKMSWQQRSENMNGL